MKSPLAIYQEHLDRGELAYQVSLSDGRAVFFPRVIAPGTGSDDLQWRRSGGKGVVYATTVAYYKGEPPLNVALIDLEEGFRMMSRVEGVPAEAVRIGMRVMLRVLPAGEGTPALPVFIPEEAS
jgi:Predicted nucleic-acid-binding protein containing a Zn-ribbon